MPKIYGVIKDWYVQNIIFLVEKQENDILHLIMLSICYGAYFFLLILLKYLPGYVTDNKEFSLFVVGWISVPILTALAVFGISILKNKYFQDDVFFYPILLAINCITGTIFTFWICLAWQMMHSYCHHCSICSTTDSFEKQEYFSDFTKNLCFRVLFCAGFSDGTVSSCFRRQI